VYIAVCAAGLKIPVPVPDSKEGVRGELFTPSMRADGPKVSLSEQAASVGTWGQAMHYLSVNLFAEKPTTAVLAVTSAVAVVCTALFLAPASRFRSGAGFMVCAASMLLCNKFAVHYLQVPATIVFCQLFVTAVFVRTAYALGWVTKMTLLPWGSEAFFYFVPVSITFMISVVWGSKILSAAPLETMIVLRAVTVLLVCLLEGFVLQKTFSVRSLLSVCAVVAFSIAYARAQADSFTLALSYSMGLWACAFCFDQIFLKHMINKLQLPTWTFVYYTNALSCLFTVPLVVLEALEFVPKLRAAVGVPGGLTEAAPGALLLAGTCVLGLCMAHFSFEAREAFSATACAMMGHVCKMFTILGNAVIWSNHVGAAGTIAVVGLVVSGSFFDGAVPKKEEARESKMEEASPEKAKK